MPPLDFLGTLILTFSVVILFLMILGLPLVRGINNRKNLQRHGILAASALVMQTGLFVVEMFPALAINFGSILDLKPVYAINVWLHFTAGSVAFISGFAYAGLWLASYTSQMRCVRLRKYMMPTLILWALAIVTGGLIHFLQMF
ncbi:MAG TPA: hypothetical protein VK253_04615 [Candidatus Binatia bacterium]|nr:hypothetical protein [Candidatus Binatia bacterium]